MKLLPRHRYLFLIGGTLVATLASLITDPDAHGLSTFLGALAIGQGIWAVAAAHWGRKALTDYPEADQRNLFAKAGETSVGAGLALIALAIIFVGLLLVFAPRAHASTIPAGFYKYGPILKAQQKEYWPYDPNPPVLAALVEQESCATKAMCWNPKARLKTSREEGAGMGQITRAYRADGSVRFDALSGLRDQYYSELNQLSWGNVYERPDLQLRAVVLMSRDNVRPFRYTKSSLEFGDAAYNGGVSGVQKERRACKLTTGCDSEKWFHNVELHCMKSKMPIYGGRSACDINREHVRNVFLVRLPKYIKPWAEV